MGLNIKNAEVERLAAEVSRMAHESKTEAIRVALEERKEKLRAAATSAESRRARVVQFLERSVWPNVLPEARGKMPGKDEMDELSGM